MQPPDDGGRSPKRLAVDPEYRARLEVADDYQLPLSEFNSWEVDDQAAAVGKRLFEHEKCGECGVHPTVWNPALGGHPNAMVAVWKHCRVCELIAQAREAGPPAGDGTQHGWHLTLQHKHV